jgi:hypothetical protein
MSTKTTIESHKNDCVSALRTALKSLLKERHNG